MNSKPIDRRPEHLEVREGQSTGPGSVIRTSLMDRLQQIRIDAPEDFSENLDLYLTGQKAY